MVSFSVLGVSAAKTLGKKLTRLSSLNAFDRQT